MSPSEYRQLEAEADSIRAKWLAPEPAAPESPAPADTTTVTSEMFIKNAKRPLGMQDIGFLAALDADKHAPWWMRSREDRRTRARLLKYMRCPDQTGMESPSDEEWNLFPELFEAFLKQQQVRR